MKYSILKWNHWHGLMLYIRKLNYISIQTGVLKSNENYLKAIILPNFALEHLSRNWRYFSVPILQLWTQW